MWSKDDYQEHMLGYLDGVQTEFEQFVHAQFRQHKLNEFYTSLDITLECLWQLIGASDMDWEGYRYPLETRCNELLRMFYPGLWADSLMSSPGLIIIEDEWQFESWEQAEMV